MFRFPFIIVAALFFSLSLHAQVKPKAKPAPARTPTATSAPATPSQPKTTELTGIWRGSFGSETRRMGGHDYKYEVQFVQSSAGALKGVTYSWQNDIGFYGKANGTGIYMQNASTLILKEVELEEITLGSESSYGCLMTCYLDYAVEGGKQILVGTYTSVMSRNPNRDCGNGTVRLEKVPDSKFGIEPLVLERLQAIQREEKKKVSAPAVKPPPVTTVGRIKTPPPVAKAKQKVAAKPPVVAKSNKPLPTPQKTPTPTQTQPGQPAQPIETIAPTVKKPAPRPAPPSIFTQRKTQIEKTYVVEQSKATISFYDVGDVDGDEISVYVNNRLVINHARLTARANSITLELDANDPVQEITVVAENMGSIPPNTAFVVIESGSIRHEITLTSNMEKNARVLLEYRPKGSAK